MTDIILESVVTCPKCGATTTEQMPTNACQRYYQCNMCDHLMKPKEGDCCIFCSYGTVKCPPMQERRESGDGCCCG